MSTCGTNACETTKVSLGRFVGAGMLGGAVGGLVFGVMMGMMDMLPMIASMLDSSSVVVGFVIHMIISVFFGALGGVGLFYAPTCMPKTIVFGITLGVALWVVGPLVAMPVMMSMPVFTINNTTLMSLMGHLMYGVVTAVVARLFVSRSVSK